MSHKRHKAVFVEAKVLGQLQDGSYEEILSTLDRAVAENQGAFGGESVLFATYPDRVIVLNEDGIFHSANYVIDDGIVRLGKPKRISVETLSEDDVVSRGVDAFTEGTMLADSMRGLMSLHPALTSSPLEQVRESLGQLFSRGRIWKKVIHEHKLQIGEYAWDADYGNLELTIRPLFGELFEEDDDEIDDGVRDVVVENLISLEGRLGEMLSRVHESHDSLTSSNTEMRDEDDDAILSQFDSYATDYMEHLGEVVESVSAAIRMVRDGGCVLCGAKVHDEIALRYRDFDLGGRFVRKVAQAIA